MKKHPLGIWSSVIWFSLCLCLVLPAQEQAKESPKAEAEQDLYRKVLGYWVVDAAAAETKAFVAEMVKQGAPADIQKEMETSTFEFKPGQMVIHEKDDSTIVKITVKSQDLEKGVLVADFEGDDGDLRLTTLRINGDLLVMNLKEDEGKEVSFGLKRINEETFKKRVPEPKDEKAAEEQQDQQEPQADELKDDYPIATAVPDKPGFVFSPYNRKLIDVTDSPSGTLVMDPHFPPTEKKFFRVP